MWRKSVEATVNDKKSCQAMQCLVSAFDNKQEGKNAVHIAAIQCLSRLE